MKLTEAQVRALRWLATPPAQRGKPGVGFVAPQLPTLKALTRMGLVEVKPEGGRRLTVAGEAAAIYLETQLDK